MKKLIGWLILAASVAVCAAQVPPITPTIPRVTQGNMAGLLYASNFGQWEVPQGNLGTYSWSSASFCYANTVGVAFQAFTVGTPIDIVDTGNPANDETVTPTAVTIVPATASSLGTCSITIAPVHPHTFYYYTSATAGLQETLNWAGTTPYTIIVTPDWSLLGGITSTITSAKGNTSVTILDERTSNLETCTWATSAYACTALGGGGSPGGPASGDLAGSYPSPTVAGIGGTALNLSGTGTAQIIGVKGTLYSGSIETSANCDAMGDSQTIGAFTSAQMDSWPSLIGAWTKTPCQNHGISGITTNGQDNNILNDTYNSIPDNNNHFIYYMLGTNNVSTGGNSAPQAADYGANLEAQLAFQAITPTARTRASTWSKSGTWGSSPSYTGDIASVTLNDTATFSATGSTIIVSTVQQATASQGGSATLTCDSTPTGASLSFAGNSGATILAGNQTAITIVTGLTNTTHSCVITVTSSGTIVELAWAGGIANSSNPTWRTVVAGNMIPRFDAFAPDVAIYTPYISGAVTTLNAIGLTNLHYCDTTPNMIQAIYANTGHPGDFGTYTEALNWLGCYNTIMGTNVAPPIYQMGIVGNMSQQGTNFVWSPQTASGLTATAETNAAQGNFMFGGGWNITSGSNNTGFGFQAAPSLTTGIDDTVFGAGAGATLTVQSDIAAIGQAAESLAGTSAGESFVGGTRGLNLNNGLGNDCFGFRCGYTDSFLNPMFAITTDSDFNGMGRESGKLTTTALSNFGAWGATAFASASGAYEIGAGNCITANAVCFEGSALPTLQNGLLPFNPSAVTAAGTLTSANVNSGYNNLRSRWNIVGGTFTTGTFLTVPFGVPLASVTITAQGGSVNPYAVNQTITLSCSITNAVLLIQGVASGGVDLVEIITPGNGCATATGVTQLSTSGTGTGAVFSTTAGVVNAGQCTATQQGGTGWYGLTATATATGYTLASANTIAGATFSADVTCQQ